MALSDNFTPTYGIEKTPLGNKILKINIPEGVDIVSMLDAVKANFEPAVDASLKSGNWIDVSDSFKGDAVVSFLPAPEKHDIGQELLDAMMKPLDESKVKPLFSLVKDDTTVDQVVPETLTPRKLTQKMLKNKILGRMIADATAIGRRFYFNYNVQNEAVSSADAMMTEVVPTHKEGKNAPINLIGSEVVPGFHAPVLDMDFPVHVMPSRTPGHSHLYIDKLISWDDYSKLLKLMSDIGLIEKGYAESALVRKETYVRIPDPSYL